MTNDERISKLEGEVEELREQVSVLCTLLGINSEEMHEELRKRTTLPAPPPASSHPPAGV